MEIKTQGKGGYSVLAPDVEVQELDLNDLLSVERFANGVLARQERIDLLINNAGIMALAQQQFTATGFEKQMGVNHFGHFYLTQLLLPKMQAQNFESELRPKYMLY